METSLFGTRSLAICLRTLSGRSFNCNKAEISCEGISRPDERIAPNTRILDFWFVMIESGFKEGILKLNLCLLRIRGCAPPMVDPYAYLINSRYMQPTIII